MITGSGNIAKVLQDREGAIFFARGVSNSALPDESPEFKREKDAILDLREEKGCFFYFGSISIFYKNSPYTRHKIRMEQLIRSNFNNYNIIRVGNLSWDLNPNTFINAIRLKKINGEPFELIDEYRYMIDIDELLLLTNNLPLVGQNEINVFGKMAKPKDLI